MSISTETYDQIYDEYTTAMKWMQDIGVKLGPGRTAHYERVIRQWKDAYQTATSDEGKAIFPAFVSAMSEVHDFINVYNAFRTTSASRLNTVIEKLRIGVNGPFNAADETPDSTRARNFLFEAAVAARAHRPDSAIEAILDARSDTGIRLAKTRIWIECKRVTSEVKIEKNVRDASKQLEEVLKLQVGSGQRGIVALDVSKILNKGDQIYVTRNDPELLAEVDRIVVKFIEDHSAIWDRVYEKRHRKVIGTLVRLSFMASSESRNLLVYCEQWAMRPRQNVKPGDEKLLVQLVDKLNYHPS